MDFGGNPCFETTVHKPSEADAKGRKALVADRTFDLHRPYGALISMRVCAVLFCKGTWFSCSQALSADSIPIGLKLQCSIMLAVGPNPLF